MSTGVPDEARVPTRARVDDFADRAVLVTGGAGFIGSHLTDRLVDAGARVTVVDSLRTGCLTNLAECLERVEYIEDDILSDSFHALLADRQFDAIFHLAANPYVPPSVEHPWLDFELNAVGTLRLLESLRQGGRGSRVIVVSSAAVYGEADSSPLREEDPTVPISPYGVSKLAAERYAGVYARVYGLSIASLRLFSAYGPRQRKQVIYDLIRKLSSGPREIEVLGDGTQVRDFNYVDDVVAAALCVARRGPLGGEAYNVASGQSCAIEHLVELLCGLTGVRPRVRWSGVVRPGDPQRWVPDISRVKALGWAPVVSLHEGLQRTLAWYRAAGQRESPGG